ncbi:aromatic acid exporter family protein [Aerococcaceae bacterium DSM 111176]|nr:aromatic acid exporter family protein [Aerococcaceae bacterium DSM 111176]
MKIGARVFKTGLAIIISVYLSTWLIPDNSPSLAAVAAITTTMPSVKQSYDAFTKRVVSNTIGGLVGVFLMFTIGNSPVAIGVGVMLTIAILNALKLGDVITLAVITVVVIMLTTNPNFVLIAIYRVLETVIGVIISFLVNWIVYPPHYDQIFYETLTETTNEMLVSIRASLRQSTNFSIMHQDHKQLESKVSSIETYFSLMREEVIIDKRRRPIVARRLVIFRHMVRLTKRTFSMVRVFHKNDHVYNDFSPELRDLVRERMETLLSAHEQILLKFSGRVSPDEVRFIEQPMDWRDEYLEKFFEQAKIHLHNDDSYATEVNGVIHIMSSIYRYEEEINKLNNLIRIYLERYNIEDGLEDEPDLDEI